MSCSENLKKEKELSAHELAELTGVSVSTIHYYNTPTYQRRTNPDRARRLIAI